MSFKNRYIFVESLSESKVVQKLLFEAGAGWGGSGKSLIPVYNRTIMIDDKLEMFAGSMVPSDYKKLTLDELVEIVKRDASEVDNSYHVCKFSNNHIYFDDTEVGLSIDEMSELLQVIRSLSHRDFEITTIDETDCDQLLPLTNLTIHFK